MIDSNNNNNDNDCIDFDSYDNKKKIIGYYD